MLPVAKSWKSSSRISRSNSSAIAHDYWLDGASLTRHADSALQLNGLDFQGWKSVAGQRSSNSGTGSQVGDSWRCVAIVRVRKSAMAAIPCTSMMHLPRLQSPGDLLPRKRMQRRSVRKCS
nr:hypothetical protein [Paucimonas lemoignei]